MRPKLLALHEKRPSAWQKARSRLNFSTIASYHLWNSDAIKKDFNFRSDLVRKQFNYSSGEKFFDDFHAVASCVTPQNTINCLNGHVEIAVVSHHRHRKTQTIELNQNGISIR